MGLNLGGLQGCCYVTTDDVDQLPPLAQAEEARARTDAELEAVLAKLGFEEAREL